MSLPTSGNEAFDCLSALSVILDLANGFAEDKSLLTAVTALEVARVSGADEATQWQAALAALLRHLGCTAYASTEATLAEDDIGLRSRLHHVDVQRPLEVARAIASSSQHFMQRVSGLAALVINRAQHERDWTREACGAARMLARQLGLGAEVARALDEVFERFDGRGSPKGTKGEALSLVARIAHAAHAGVIAWLSFGPEQAHAVLAEKAGTVLDPGCAQAASHVISGEAGAWLEEHQAALRALAAKHPLEVELVQVAAAFGDFADLQVPDGVGHSRAVAELVSAATARLGFTVAERRDAVLAAHLHDLGQVAVPTGIWLTPRAFRESERERARMHVYFTERVLKAAAPLASVARIAAAHHERLDGSGYHHGLRDNALPRTARLLAAADVWCALRAKRPHRPAFSVGRAKELMREEVARGTLDAECVDALLGAERPAPVAVALTEREFEVLQLLAQGSTNKEIAVSLGISARTVQHHTIHIYEKLGVDTRAGATLCASQRGLLAPR